MVQEPSSTVKHVNWYWPDCLVGDGTGTDNTSARGVYNVCQLEEEEEEEEAERY
jgi:hypothetical protein